MKEGKVLPVKPGQSIRFPVEARGRYQPVTISKRLGEHSIDISDLRIDNTGAAEVLDTATKKN